MRPIQLLLSAMLLATQFVPHAPQPGTIAGNVAIKPMPPQEAASRYPTAGGHMQKTTLPIPTVVYLDGPVAGAPAWAERSKVVVVQRDFQFSPNLVVIPTNTTVSFPNEDREFHNVFSYSKSKRFDLGRYPKGESKDVIFDKPGVVKIYCEVHPWMRAVVLVLENPFYAIVAADGSFSIRGIPAGHYDMVVWNIDAGAKRLSVDVPSASTAELQIQLTGASHSTDRGPATQEGRPAAKTASIGGAFIEGACCAKKR